MNLLQFLLQIKILLEDSSEINSHKVPPSLPTTRRSTSTQRRYLFLKRRTSVGQPKMADFGTLVRTIRFPPGGIFYVFSKKWSIFNNFQVNL